MSTSRLAKATFNRISGILPALFLLPVTCLPGLAAERVAVVIGNGNYASAQSLPNPTRDAAAVAKLLKAQGFEVVEITNAGVDAIYEGLEVFKTKAARAKVGLFYYAGHGIEVDGKNYLLPVDAELESSAQLRTQAVSLDVVLGDMRDAKIPAKLVILDCCRDNPLIRSWMRTRTSQKGGLSKIEDRMVPPATMIMFASAPGEVALDGTGKNSPFTSALIEQFAKPGVSAFDAFLGVSDSVAKSTGERQVPWIKFDGAGRTFRLFSLGMDDGSGPAVAPVPAEPRMTEAEIQRRARELAEEMAAEAAKEREASESSGGAPTMVARPGDVGGFPAGSKMEGTKAGEVREFGGIEMVWCPAGTFIMGSPEDEDARDDDETQHLVRLTKGYWLAKTECTQGHWESVMGSNPSFFEGSSQLPMEQVSWDDVQVWLAKMNAKDLLPAGWKWELPTEAQWEYASRAGTTGMYGGSESLSEMGWYGGNSGNKTHEVGKKRANDWGLYDMHGNVWEWCCDEYGDYASGLVIDPSGSVSGTYRANRVYRGGCWFNTEQFCRSAGRLKTTPGFRGNFLGFRPALVPSR